MVVSERFIIRFEVVEEDSAWVVIARDVSGIRLLVRDHDDWLHAHLHASRLNRKLHTPHRRLTRVEIQRFLARNLRGK